MAKQHRFSDTIVREYLDNAGGVVEVEFDVQFNVYPGEAASSSGPGEDAYLEDITTAVIWGSITGASGRVVGWLMHPINIELTEQEKDSLLVEASDKIADHYRAQEEATADARRDR
jgi:hypothetical protein